MQQCRIQFASPKPWRWTIALALLVIGNARAQTPNTDPVITAIQAQPGAGEIITLIEQDPSVWAVTLTAATTPPRGTVILLHDLGGHADSPRVIASLRRQLHAAGWSSFSVTLTALRPRQLTATADELFKTSQTALDAAISKARAQNPGPLVFLGYGMGAVVAAQYLAAKTNHGVAGFVAIATPVDKMPYPELYVPEYLKKVTIPILDIFGGNDDARVVSTAAQRSQAMRAALGPASSKSGSADQDADTAPPRYRQVALMGADHEFTGMDVLLGKRVVTWLGRYFAEAGK